jgi:hypothetical protein
MPDGHSMTWQTIPQVALAAADRFGEAEAVVGGTCV